MAPLGPSGWGSEAQGMDPGVVAAITATLCVVLNASADTFRLTAVRPVGWVRDDAREDLAWRLAGRLEPVLRLHEFTGRRQV